MNLEQKWQRRTVPQCTDTSSCRNLVFNLANPEDLPLHTAVWTLVLHFPEVAHLTSSLTPDKMNPCWQLSWQTVPGLAGCLPQFGGEMMTPLGFWKVGHWRSVVGKRENVICVLTSYKCRTFLHPAKGLTMLVGPTSCSTPSSRYVSVNELNLCVIVHFILLYQRDQLLLSLISVFLSLHSEGRLLDS